MKLGVIVVECVWQDRFWPYERFERCQYAAYLHAPADEVAEDDGTYLDLPDAEGGNFQKVTREAEDTLFEHGYTHARIEGDLTSPTHRLNQTRRRIAVRAARIEAEREAAEKAEATRLAQIERYKQNAPERRRLHRNYLAGCRRARLIVDEMAHPTPSTIRKFYRRWRKKQYRDILSKAKDILMRHVLSLAQEGGWVYGRAADRFCHPDLKYRDILYVDTPKGQVSFHFAPGSLGDLPDYPGTWSNLRNSDQILERVFAPPV